LTADEAPQWKRELWPQTAELFTRLFKTKTREQWTQVFDGTDACVAPVLGLAEVTAHPHNQARHAFVRGVGDMVFPNAAPRLSRTPGAVSAEAPLPGADTHRVLEEIGLDEAEREALARAGVIG
jgi:alpha-methylacyl-CoA racemase